MNEGKRNRRARAEATPPRSEPPETPADSRLDEALEDTFPASDPVALHPTGPEPPQRTPGASKAPASARPPPLDREARRG